MERIADYITLIDHGKIFYTGTKDSLVEHFCIVKGGKTDLTDELKKKIIGLSMTSTGFTGMLPASELKGLPSGVVTEEPTIDEILIHIAKGDI